jgi:leucyl/phenylalanyl-tRNA---protein transferase
MPIRHIVFPMTPRDRPLSRAADATRYFCLATETWSNSLPDPQCALEEPNGLLAMGGDLTVSSLLAAYRRGIFPWYSVGQPLLWWSPNPRAVLRPEAFHVSRSFCRSLKQLPWRVTVDTEFTQVLQACAEARADAAGTWLTHDMQVAYLELHRAGHAHSLECWLDERLVGGIYGVAMGQLFFGESMFSRVSNGSKVALYALCRRLVDWGYRLLDCQVPNPHLESLGMSLLSREEFDVALQSCTDSEAPGAWLGPRVPTPP